MTAMKSLIVAVLRALAIGLIVAPNASAVPVTYNFSIASSSWLYPGQEPYGMSLQSTLNGTLEVDSDFAGMAALTDFSLTTGSRTWTLDDLELDTQWTGMQNRLSFNPGGYLDSFALIFGTYNGTASPGPWMYVASGSTFGVRDGPSFNACNGCVTFDNRNPSVGPIPEPSTYALMLAGLGAVAFAARRRKGATV